MHQRGLWLTLAVDEAQHIKVFFYDLLEQIGQVHRDLVGFAELAEKALRVIAHVFGAQKRNKPRDQRAEDQVRDRHAPGEDQPKGQQDNEHGSSLRKML